MKVSMSNIQKGVFRIWVAVSGLWMTLCAVEVANLPGNCYIGRCDIFVRAFFNIDMYNVDVSYWGISKAFIGIPMLAFAIGLAVCWVIDGFRRSTQTEVTGSEVPRTPRQKEEIVSGEKPL
jgi:hypothetical protein